MIRSVFRFRKSIRDIRQQAFNPAIYGHLFGRIIHQTCQYRIALIRRIRLRHVSLRHGGQNIAAFIFRLGLGWRSRHLTKHVLDLGIRHLGLDGLLG